MTKKTVDYYRCDWFEGDEQCRSQVSFIHERSSEPWQEGYMNGLGWRRMANLIEEKWQCPKHEEFNSHINVLEAYQA